MTRIEACLFFLAACACRGGAQRAADGDGTSGASRGVPCGPLDCRQYDTLEEAFESALASHPRVVAIGEAHAQKTTTVPSSAKHFTEEVLPHLGGRASDLLLEILKPPAGCGETTAAVRQEHEVVTRSQAPTDQGEYVTMGERARALGIVPDLLRPTCADLAAIKAATDDPITPSLETIARLTRVQVEKLVDRDARSDADAGKFVLTYGGALHVELDPPRARATWSFGHELDAYTGGRYVAIQLFLPELIDDSPSWKEREFTKFYDPARLGAKTTVYRTGKTFVIVLPRTEVK
jgi:hypothetical protein